MGDKDNNNARSGKEGGNSCTNESIEQKPM